MLLPRHPWAWGTPRAQLRAPTFHTAMCGEHLPISDNCEGLRSVATLCPAGRRAPCFNLQFLVLLPMSNTASPSDTFCES